LQQSVADLGVAYKNFFDSLKGKRKGKKVGKPKAIHQNSKRKSSYCFGRFERLRHGKKSPAF
ncbi:MAG: hypothetical protein NWQ28_06120, partial [Nodularia sp. (in: cyanobacteria)]|nr:hypothetical protein [Nodularia sp. (in: cyanobacteria)]